MLVAILLCIWQPGLLTRELHAKWHTFNLSGKHSRFLIHVLMHDLVAVGGDEKHPGLDLRGGNAAQLL